MASRRRRSNESRRDDLNASGLFGRNARWRNSMTITQLLRGLGVKTMSEILSLRDVDHYNVLEKAIVYGHLPLLRSLLREFYWEREAKLGDELHLACFVGVLPVVQAIVRAYPALLDRHGRVSVNSVAGPPNHLLNAYLKPHGYDIARLRLAWLKQHQPQVPLFFAVVGDNEAVLEAYYPISVKSVQTINSLLECAFECRSSRCLRYLTTVVPDAFERADANGRPYWLRSVEFGCYFLQDLLDFGLPLCKLRVADPLKLFYLQLVHENSKYEKYKRVFDSTMFFIRNGCRYDIHSVSLLAGMLNKVITSNGEFVTFDDQRELQRRFDVDVVNCLRLFSRMKLGDETYRIAESLLRNGNFVLRYEMSRKCRYFGDRTYGMSDQIDALRRFCDASFDRNKLDAVHLHVSSLRTRVRCVTAHDSLSRAWSNVLCILLDAGFDDRSSDRKLLAVPPLFAFVDSIWQEASKLTDALQMLALQRLATRTVAAFCQRRSPLVCISSIDHVSCVRHGCLDGLVGALVSHPLTTTFLNFSIGLLTDLRKCGIPSLVYNWIGLFTGARPKQQDSPCGGSQLLYYVLQLDVTDTGATVIRELCVLLIVLARMMEPGDVRRSLRDAHFDQLQPSSAFTKFDRLLRRESLRSFARTRIFLQVVSLGGNFDKSVQRMKLPVALKDYLQDLEVP